MQYSCKTPLRDETQSSSTFCIGCQQQTFVISSASELLVAGQPNALIQVSTEVAAAQARVSILDGSQELKQIELENPINEVIVWLLIISFCNEVSNLLLLLLLPQHRH